MFTAAAAATLLLVAALSQQAAAAPIGSPVQSQIDAALAASPGGTQINENQISWEDGAVILTIPLPGERYALGPGEEVGASGTHDCDYTFTCLYEHEQFEGRRLDFSKCGVIYDLGNWNFNDMASSYHNNQSGGARTTVYNWEGSWVRIWITSAAPTWSSNVGEDKNDIADGIKPC